MKYYILQKVDAGGHTGASQSSFEIVKVRPVDEANFMEDYGHLVISSGNNLAEAMLAFQEWVQVQKP
jgi:hypothetical protein